MYKKIFFNFQPHMEQRTKIMLGALAILVVGTLSLATQSSVFKGSFFEGGGDFDDLYLSNGVVVSAVTSPVSSVTTSNATSKVPSSVTSRGGTSIVTSKVTSKVTSVITSSVASAVPLRTSDAAKVDVSDLFELTGATLRKIEGEYYKENPSDFTLSREERAKVMELYDNRAPPSPMPKPRGR